MRPSSSENAMSLSTSTMSNFNNNNNNCNQLSLITRNLFESYNNNNKRRKTFTSPSPASPSTIWRPYLDHCDNKDVIVTATEQSKENITNNDDVGERKKCLSLSSHAADNRSPPKLCKFYDHHLLPSSSNAIFRPINFPELERLPARAFHHERFFNNRRTPDMAGGGRRTPDTCILRCSSSTDSNFSPSSSVGSTDDVIVSPRLKKCSAEKGRVFVFHCFVLFCLRWAIANLHAFLSVIFF